MRAEDVLRSREKKQILFVGDALKDLYIHGRIEACQDGCPKFMETDRKEVLGGVANAAQCLNNSTAPVGLIETPVWQKKVRFLDNGKIVWRQDEPFRRLTDEQLQYCRGEFFKIVAEYDAVYVADYDKGFLSFEFMQQIVSECNKRGIVCVVDPKRSPQCCEGAVLKCNAEFAVRWFGEDCLPPAVVTRSAAPPSIFDDKGLVLSGIGDGMTNHIECRNHVGAGDCFGAWLTLGLAHGLELVEAARLAHAAGRVYVQHPHNRAPWPHEIRKELDPVGGKVLQSGDLDALRQSTADRIVFTNGCYRMPHAGHSWLFGWAKKQGDVLVVGVNDDVSAFRVKHGFCLPLEERIQLLASQEAVDWVVPFSENTPMEVMRSLQPNVTVRGHDQYNDGSETGEVIVAPKSPFEAHATDILKAIRG